MNTLEIRALSEIEIEAVNGGWSWTYIGWTYIGKPYYRAPGPLAGLFAPQIHNKMK